jgi:hypothetical protein
MINSMTDNLLFFVLGVSVFLLQSRVTRLSLKVAKLELSSCHTKVLSEMEQK